MMMISSFLVGVGLGAGIVYFVLRQKFDHAATVELELQQVRQALTDAETAHQLRLKEAIAALQVDYQQRNDSNLQALSEKYEAKLQGLEQELNAVAVATPPNTLEDLAIAPPQQSRYEPIPILAAEISYLTPPPPRPIATPTGKAIDPPILAQFAVPPIPSTPETAHPNDDNYNHFEPPILMTSIQSASPQPPSVQVQPTGKMIDPPILAQP